MDMSRAGLGRRAGWTLRKRSASRHEFVIIAFEICHEFITSGIVQVHCLVLDLGKTYLFSARGLALSATPSEGGPFCSCTAGRRKAKINECWVQLAALSA